MSDASVSPRPHRTTPLAGPGALVRGGARAPSAAPPERDLAAEPEGTRSTQSQRPSWLDAALAGRLRRGAEAIHLSPDTVIPRYRLLWWSSRSTAALASSAEGRRPRHWTGAKIVVLTSTAPAPVHGSVASKGVVCR